jgi:hypothetical protein
VDYCDDILGSQVTTVRPAAQHTLYKGRAFVRIFWNRPTVVSYMGARDPRRKLQEARETDREIDAYQGAFLWSLVARTSRIQNLKLIRGATTMVEGRNKVEELYRAGVLLIKDLSKEEVEIINSLTPEEIEFLKNLKEKLGDHFVKPPGCSGMI